MANASLSIVLYFFSMSVHVLDANAIGRNVLSGYLCEITAPAPQLEASVETKISSDGL